MKKFRICHKDGRPVGRMKVGMMNPYMDYDTREEAEALLEYWRREREKITDETKKKYWIPDEMEEYIIKEFNE